MFGRFIFAGAVCPALVQLGRTDSAPAEAAAKLIVLRNSLLVCSAISFPFLTPAELSTRGKYRKRFRWKNESMQYITPNQLCQRLKTFGSITTGLPCSNFRNGWTKAGLLLI
jgi:hypothetical protein